MGRLFVPVSGRYDVDEEKTLLDLKKIGAHRVYISIGERFPFEKGERRDKVLSELKRKAELYTSAGIEAAVWIDTLGFGGGSTSYNKKKAAEYTKIRSIIGRELDDAFCPLDDAFTDMMCELIRDICRTGIKMLMLDDELCLSVRPGIGCACELHMKEYRRRIGEDIAIEEIASKAFMGEPSRYREEWIDLMGDTMRTFCSKVRAAVDEVDPSIRLGFCSGFTSWDLEGADALELTKILAGANKPFLRFTGAPYWLANRRFGRQPLNSIIECARMQYALCKGRGIEVFSEADTYPRDRYHTPAAYSECFDLATRASDGMDAMKYMYEYCCQPDYDAGYVKTHLRDLSLYEDIDRAFGDKECVGVRIYNTVRKIKNATLPTVEGRDFDHEDEKRVETRIFPSEEKLLSANTIPTVYEGSGVCGIAFGENAKYLPPEAFEKGLIIDAKAAQILNDMGVDTGFASCKKAANRFMEAFGEDKRKYALIDTASVCIMELRSGARTVSRFVSNEMYNEEEYPAAYTYENSNGQRFLVYAFDAESLSSGSSLFWSYERGRQIAELVPWLGGENLPAVCQGNPMLYQLCKKNNAQIAAAFINCHEDEIYDARVMLSEPIEKIEFIGCKGRLVNEKEIVIDNIKAFGFAAFLGVKS